MGLFSKDIKSMDDLFLHTLRDIFYAENQIVKALPKLIEKVTNRELTSGLSSLPVPPEWISVELTRQACMSHIGYLIALQYLQQAAAYRNDFPDIGQWECIEHANPVQGVAGM